MVCLSCAGPTRGRLCPRCASTVHPARDRILAGGIPVVAAFEHDGAARRLIHHLKYRGVAAVAELAAEVLAPRLPRAPLLPVPRVWSRRLKYGIDPAREIALALGRRLQVPTLSLLVPPVHSRRRAGRDHSRPVRPFRTRSTLRSPVIIVDDVVTTGGTVLAAVEAVGADMVRTIVAANVVSDVSNVNAVVTSPEQECTRFGNRTDSRRRRALP